ncbi:MFS transporter [Actinotalea sp. Marseille-Q4924]|uniref:MFS transporter n=1 Tax=Actinotalea sp. Marseille-Q4924 TaxID=2866571 RepID=UPI001CE42D27|nr:MFS transporter [Actinotalea sp. Marseille-Q4924]
MTDAGPVEAAAPPPRSWVRLLLDPLYGAFFLGRMLSSTGIWIHSITAAVLTYELTRSAFMVGLVSVAQFIPQVLFAAFTGSLADRGDRKRQVMAGRLVVTSGSGGLALWTWALGTGAPGTEWVIVLSALVVGIGFVTGGPAMHAMVPALVRPGELDAAVTLNMLPVTLSRAIGPAIGAAVALSAGADVAFALAAAGNLGFVLVLLRMRVPQAERDPAADTSMRAAFAHLRVDRTVALLLLGVAAVGVGADPAITLAPSISSEMGYGTSQTGTFAAAFGVGAGVAFLVIPVIRRAIGLPWSATAGLLLIGVGYGAVAGVSTPWAAVPGFAVAGLGMTFAVTGLSALLQRRLPDQLRGRIMALWSVGFLGSRPFAAALNGAVADLVSVDAALVVVMVLMVGAARLCRPSTTDRPPPVPD